VRGVVYEVTTSEKEGSAFGLIANLAAGQLKLGLGGANVLGNFI
jgi:general secretion pathway protein D